MKHFIFSLLLLLCISPCFASSIEIETPSVPNGTINTEYSAMIKAKGGCTPYAWQVISGSLPPGISSKPSTKTTSLDLSGTPRDATSYSFTISATDCQKRVSHQSYKIVIQAGANHVVDLSWKASSSTDIAGYNVYRGASATSMSKINSSLVASTIYDDSTVANDSTYYYATTAVDTEGNESVKSGAVEVAVP